MRRAAVRSRGASVVTRLRRVQQPQPGSYGLLGLATSHAAAGPGRVNRRPSAPIAFRYEGLADRGAEASYLLHVRDPARSTRRLDEHASSGYIKTRAAARLKPPPRSAARPAPSRHPSGVHLCSSSAVPERMGDSLVVGATEAFSAPVTPVGPLEVRHYLTL
jgi:hypothetical protein